MLFSTLYKCALRCLRRISAVVAIAIAALTISTPAKAHFIEIAVDMDNWPYVVVEDGHVGGIYVRIAEEAFRRARIHVKFVPRPWRRAYNEALEGQRGMLGVYYNDQRAKVFSYSKPYFRNHLVAFTDINIGRRIRELQDLQYYRIGVIPSISYGAEVDAILAKSDVQTIPVDRHEIGFSMLTAGRFDIFMSTTTAGLSTLVRMEKDEQFQPLEWSIAVNDLHLVFAKSMGQEETIRAFDAAIAEMSEDGSLASIVLDYIHLHDAEHGNENSRYLDFLATDN